MDDEIGSVFALTLVVDLSRWATISSMSAEFVSGFNGQMPDAIITSQKIIN